MSAPWDKPNSPLAALTHLQSAVKESHLAWLSFHIRAPKKKKKRRFDWNKRLRVISQVQITLIQRCRSGTGTQPGNQLAGNISLRTHQWKWGWGGLMDGKSRCALQFLTSLLIHPPDKFVQNMTLIYFYEGISLALDLGWGSNSGLSWKN